ncbi:hypothetical protein CDIK_0836 [Cucumispora dikerogammari]|nr:hypothetical protein CDIK_0836 [Cucumispora dikerogammari]
MQARANVVDSLFFKTKTTGYLDPLLANIDSTMLLVLNEMKGELKTGLIKKLTRKDMVNARCLYTNQNRLCVFNVAIIGTTNFGIKVDNYNYAIERRIKLYNTKCVYKLSPEFSSEEEAKNYVLSKDFLKKTRTEIIKQLMFKNRNLPPICTYITKFVDFHIQFMDKQIIPKVVINKDHKGTMVSEFNNIHEMIIQCGIVNKHKFSLIFFTEKIMKCKGPNDLVIIKSRVQYNLNRAYRYLFLDMSVVKTYVESLVKVVK